jgi:hypothetical protein
MFTQEGIVAFFAPLINNYQSLHDSVLYNGVRRLFIVAL